MIRWEDKSTDELVKIRENYVHTLVGMDGIPRNVMMVSPRMLREAITDITRILISRK